MEEVQQKNNKKTYVQDSKSYINGRKRKQKGGSIGLIASQWLPAVVELTRKFLGGKKKLEK